MLPLARIAKEIGIVLSGANALYAPIALRRDVELEAREEDLVLIYDERFENYYMLGVLRWVTRYEPFLRRATHNVYLKVREEDLVLIYDDRFENYYMLGVLRWVTRYEPFLKGQLTTCTSSTLKH